MLSICIPVYNVDIVHLVEDLIKQASAISLLIEINIIDDGSRPAYKRRNRIITQYQCINYQEQNNKGSASIRNQMAGLARFENILFLDADSALPSDYLARYQSFLDRPFKLICGGRIHDRKFLNAHTRLRWKVGRKREDRSARRRNIVPNQSFMSNNFLVKTKLFQNIGFNESIKRSGHEDTLYGIELEKRGIGIEHIDNHIIHTGLEHNHVFIRKTEQRLRTLKKIESMHGADQLLYDRIRILKYHKWLKRLHLTPILHFSYNNFKKPLIDQLTGKHPNLYLYDFYKLAYYSKITATTKT